MKIEFVILGQPYSKSNSRQIVNFGDRPASIKSADAREYERSAHLQIPSAARQMIEGPVRLTARVYYSWEGPDLDASIIRDVLQARYKRLKGKLVKIAPGEYSRSKGERVLVSRGVYLNDRQVREEHYYHFIDRVNPRAEIEVEPLTPQQIELIASGFAEQERSRFAEFKSQFEEFSKLRIAGDAAAIAGLAESCERFLRAARTPVGQPF